MTSEYRFERLNARNISDLLPLYANAFKEHRTLQDIKAKFDTSKFGAQNLAYIAYDNSNTAAAFYALFPVVIQKNGEKIIAAQVGDLMTHSKHRRKGLFLALANLTHITALQENVKLIFTVPYGENSSYKGFINHLNFKKAYSLNQYVVQTNAFPLFTISEKIVVLKFIYTAYRRFVTNRLKLISFFSEPIGDRKNGGEVIKDAQFFRYKYFSPTYLIKLGEVEAWFKLKKGALVIGDIRNLTPENSIQFIAQIKHLCFVLGIRAAQFDFAPNSKNDMALSFVIKPVGFYYHVLMLPLTEDTFSDLNFCLGDLDNF